VLDLNLQMAASEKFAVTTSEFGMAIGRISAGGLIIYFSISVVSIVLAMCLVPEQFCRYPVVARLNEFVGNHLYLASDLSRGSAHACAIRVSSLSVQTFGIMFGLLCAIFVPAGQSMEAGLEVSGLKVSRWSIGAVVLCFLLMQVTPIANSEFSRFSSSVSNLVRDNRVALVFFSYGSFVVSSLAWLFVFRAIKSSLKRGG
jgi:hypothetical protein